MELGPLEEFFAPAGPLARALPTYEHRPEQVSVAVAVGAALARRGKLIVEAGTGTGKTLAYLAPALASGLRVVVSTGTKTLQEQLVGNDLPLLARAAGRSFDVQVMKGRTNYLCQTRATRVFAHPPLPGTQARASFDALVAWRETTSTGDRAELDQLADDEEHWRELTASSDQCTGRACVDYERCFVTEMRRRAQAAQLVVVNHHLYFADLSLRERAPDAAVALVPRHDLVIFDEAHELDEVAAQHFGVQVSDRRVHELLQDVGRAATDAVLAARAKPLLGALRGQVEELYSALPFERGRVRLDPDDSPPHVAARHAALDQTFDELEALLADSEGTEARGLARRAAALAAELGVALGVRRRPSLASETVRVDASPEYSQTAPHEPDARAGLVHYTELHHRHRVVVARPIDVAPLLADALAQMPAVFVSATLRVGGKFSHFRERIGVAEAEEVCVGSPFDFERNARLYVAVDLPEPDEPNFAQAAASRAVELVAAAGGGAFVLCTSHRMLAIMRDELRRHGGATVLAQGEAPKRHLLEAFRAHGDAVLVGSMTFWSGVDVAGQALRLVVLDKLPFASPADPVVAARLDHLRRQGKEPFARYQLPQAALMLRQGFGRLIRTQTDRGVVALLDKRLSTRSYGALLKKSLPACEQLADVSAVARFFAGDAPSPGPEPSA